MNDRTRDGRPIRIEPEWYGLIAKVSEKTGLSIKDVHTMLLRHLLGSDPAQREQKALDIVLEEFKITVKG